MVAWPPPPALVPLTASSRAVGMSSKQVPLAGGDGGDGGGAAAAPAPVRGSPARAAGIRSRFSTCVCVCVGGRYTFFPLLRRVL